MCRGLTAWHDARMTEAATEQPEQWIELNPLSLLVGMKNHRNPKLHDHAELADSFRRFGFIAFPTIDEATAIMVAGHGRCETLAMMKNAGQIPPARVKLRGDGEWLVPTIRGISFTNDDERDAYVVADNRHTISGGMNEEAEKALLLDLYSRNPQHGLDGLGLTEDYLGDLLADMSGDDDDDNDDQDGDGGKEVTVGEHTRLIGATPGAPAPDHKVRPPKQMTNADWTIHLSDCVEGMRREIADESIDMLVTDPPAGIKFMGREWDSDKGGRDKWIEWLAGVLREAYRTMKPGAYGWVWALPRTSHWTGMAIEYAGFEIQDRASHLFLSGYPKSMDVSKAVDAKLGAERPVIGRGVAQCTYLDQGVPCEGHDNGTLAPTVHVFETGPGSPEAAEVEGYGTALKPALEDWWLIQKPRAKGVTIAENVLEHGTGGLNIDACRIPVGEDEVFRAPQSNPANRTHGDAVQPGAGGDAAKMQAAQLASTERLAALGRWPSHLAVSKGITINDVERPALYFYCPKPAKSETEAGLSNLPIKSSGELTNRKEGSKGLSNPRAGAGRSSGRRNTHPTKKPIALMRWLIRLVAPPTRELPPIVLDCFAGSGTTGLAALVEGCRFVGFELSAESHQIAAERMRSIIEDPRQADADEGAEQLDLELETDDSTAGDGDA